MTTKRPRKTELERKKAQRPNSLSLRPRKTELERKKAHEEKYGKKAPLPKRKYKNR